MANPMPKSKASNEPYRKVKITMWDDPKFRGLSALPPSGQSLFIYLLTSPFTGIIPGLFKAGRAAMAEELGWEIEDFDLALGEALSLGMVKADLKARVFWLPNAAKHNPPASGNVVKSWVRAFELLPECDLKWEARESLKAACYGVSETMGKAFDMAIPLPKDKPKAMPSGIQKAVNSKQILKDQNPKTLLSGADKTQPPTETPVESVFIRLPLNDGTDFLVTEPMIDEWSGLYPAVDIQQELRKQRGWLLAEPKKRKTSRGIRKFITGWLSKEQDRPAKNITTNFGGQNVQRNPTNQRGNAVQQVIDAQNAERRRQGLAPLENDGGDLRESLDYEERRRALDGLDSHDFEILG